jgi:hypothetical protein
VRVKLKDLSPGRRKRVVDDLEPQLEVELLAGAGGRGGAGVGVILRWGKDAGGPPPVEHFHRAIAAAGHGGGVGCPRTREQHVVGEEPGAAVRHLDLDAGGGLHGGAAVRGDRHGQGSGGGGSRCATSVDRVRRHRHGGCVVVAVDVGVPGGGGAVLLVRVLVAPERLRLEELLVAVEAREQPHLLPGDVRRRRRHLIHLLTASGRCRREGQGQLQPRRLQRRRWWLLLHANAKLLC